MRFTWNWNNSRSESPGGDDLGSPEYPHGAPSLVPAVLWMESHPSLSSFHFPPTAGAWLIFLSTCCAQGPQGLALTSPLPCSLQEQFLEQTAGLCSPAFPGQGPLTCFAPPHFPFQGPGLFKNKFTILFGSYYVSFYFKIQPLVKADRTICQQAGRCEVEQNGWEERSPAGLRAPGRPGRDVATLLQFPHWGQSSQGWGCGFRPEAAKREAGMGRP